jgi:transposase
VGGVRVLIAAKPVDFRKGANGLAALAKEVLAQDPFSGTIIVFRAKRADRVKILLWDGSGLVLVWKRLEQGGFKWPPIMDGVMRLSPAQLAAFDRGTGLDARARAGDSAADSCAIGAVK